MEIFKEIAILQEKYELLKKQKKLTKKNICDLVIPFRDKYRLSDINALKITRKEVSISQILKILNIE